MTSFTETVHVLWRVIFVFTEQVQAQILVAPFSFGGDFGPPYAYSLPQMTDNLGGKPNKLGGCVVQWAFILMISVPGCA